MSKNETETRAEYLLERMERALEKGDTTTICSLRAQVGASRALKAIFSAAIVCEAVETWKCLQRYDRELEPDVWKQEDEWWTFLTGACRDDTSSLRQGILSAVSRWELT